MDRPTKPHYSLAVGYLEEFSLVEWILVPINVIKTHVWEWLSLLAILTPFLAIVIFGFVLKVRKEKVSAIKKHVSSGLRTGAGLMYGL